MSQKRIDIIYEMVGTHDLKEARELEDEVVETLSTGKLNPELHAETQELLDIIRERIVLLT